MTQAKNFGFGEDEMLLRDAANKFFQQRLTTLQLHELVAGNPDPDRAVECLWPQELWQEMCELGWPMLAVPERADGLAMSAVAAVGLVHAAGQAALPSPLSQTIGCSYILSACASQSADLALGSIVEGKAFSLASSNARGSLDVANSDVAVNSGVLNGCACYVQEAQKADFIIVSARGGGGLGLYLVSSQAEGLTVTADAIVDLTRDQARITFDNVQAVELCPQGQGEDILNKTLPILLTLAAADMCGAGEWQLQTTVDYANTRMQFERQIGFFQAVKHPLVDAMMMIDQSRSLTYCAACAIDSEPDEAMRYARMANAAASDMAAFMSSRSVQFHGGIGFTWECAIHLYFKRQKHSQMLYGDAGYQREKLADIMIGTLGA